MLLCNLINHNASMFVNCTFLNGGVPCAGAFERGNVRSIIGISSPAQNVHFL
jgi:hypothetical protein